MGQRFYIYYVYLLLLLFLLCLFFIIYAFTHFYISFTKTKVFTFVSVCKTAFKWYDRIELEALLQSPSRFLVVALIGHCQLPKGGPVTS